MSKTSILLPSIRPKNLKKFYDAAAKASQNNPWELIIISPYPLPTELDRISNIKYIMSDRNPTVCKQIGALLATGKFLFNTTDDAILFPNSIDKMVEQFETQSTNPFDVINGRYREGALDLNLNPLQNIPPELSIEYWNAYHHASLRQPGINSLWKISLHFFMLANTFYEIGGLLCEGYEYSVFPILEMMFRLQFYGGKIIDSNYEVSWCSHAPSRTSDHGPVHDAMEQNDEPLFKRRWQTNIYARNCKIDYNNWKLADKKWDRRFK